MELRLAILLPQPPGIIGMSILMPIPSLAKFTLVFLLSVLFHQTQTHRNARLSVLARSPSYLPTDLRW